MTCRCDSPTREDHHELSRMRAALIMASVSTAFW